MSPPGTLSVVIVTRNRAPELASISLPSLARQTRPPDQLIVWDASDDEATLRVARTAAVSLPMLAYVPAPRRGIAAQRNDAIPCCTGSVILFLDDDTELWPDALTQLALVFDADTRHRFAGCQCTLVTTRSSNLYGRLRRFAARLYRTIFLLGTFSQHQGFLVSGHTTGGEPLPEQFAKAQAASAGLDENVQWMWGNCMAWRREVFQVPGIRFDEDLQLTSPYAFLEDVMLSRQVLRTTGMTLIRARGALCAHHTAGGRRVDLTTFGRMYSFNYWLVWHKQVRRTAVSVLAFLWSQIGLLISFAGRDIVSGHFDRVRGIVWGWQDIRHWKS